MIPSHAAGREQLLGRMILLARAEPSSSVSIAGPDSLEVLTVLCRREFQHVQCCCSDACSAANDQSDVLLLAGQLSGSALATRLHQTLRLLRNGGIVVAHLEDLDDDLLVEATLKAEACEVRATVFDLSHEVLVAHRIARPGIDCDVVVRKAA